jgi:hypothetical protein
MNDGENNFNNESKKSEIVQSIIAEGWYCEI